MTVRAALCVTAAVALAGCSQSSSPGAPAPPPITTSAPAPAPSPPRATATPFLTPADQAGAFAFVREYYKRLDEAYATGDVGPLTPMRSPTCACVRAEQSITKTAREGASTVGYVHHLDQVLQGSSGSTYSKIGVRLHTSMGRTLGPKNYSESIEPTRVVALLTLNRLLRSWAIDQIVLHVEAATS